MRLFHPKDKCDPVKREKAAEKLKAKGKGNTAPKPLETFPPAEADRVHPRNSYRTNACPRCIIEDVHPNHANHTIDKCFRVKGDYCDKVGAKTHSERKKAVIQVIVNM